MERIRFITYKGHKILYIDHTSLMDDKVVDNITTANRIVIECNDPELLVITDFTGVFATEKVMAKLKSPESMKAMQKAKKTAVLGIVGMKKILLNAFNRFTRKNLRAFTTIEEAQEYLISE